MIWKVIDYIRRKKEIFKNFNANTKYMLSGTYVLDESIKYMTRDDEDTKTRAYKMLQTDYYPFFIRVIIYFLRRTLFRKKVIIPEQDLYLSEFSGNVLRPVRSSNGYSDSKIFDLKHNKVLSIFTDRKEYSTVVQTYDFFNRHFPMPNILWTNEDRLLIMEELVLFQPKNTWEEEDYEWVISDLFKRYYVYFNECKTKGNFTYKSPTELLNPLIANSEIQFIGSTIHPELIDMKIPYLKLHGDMWTSNTLLLKAEKTQIKYIDWEYSKDFWFFYDLFNMMWLEYYVNNNFSYVKRYITGDYDEDFKKIFSLFHLHFQPEFKLDYLNLFFLNFFKERLVNLNEVDKKDSLNKYKGLLEKVNREKNDIDLMTRLYIG